MLWSELMYILSCDACVLFYGETSMMYDSAFCLCSVNSSCIVVLLLLWSVNS